METTMNLEDQSENHAYFSRRAREERERAAICEDNSAALAHLQMAEEYDKRCADSHG
jgi:hypothetical protein